MGDLPFEVGRKRHGDSSSEGRGSLELGECSRSSLSDPKRQFLAIGHLQMFGVSKGDIEKLEKAGYTTVEAVAFATSRELMTINGISENKSNLLMKEATKLVPMGFSSANEILSARETILKISTGCNEIDRILDGGVETGSITEISGECGSGKSQICHSLAVLCQLPESMGGVGGKCMWIDTENTFRPERLLAIAQRFNLTGKIVLENVTYARCYSADHQMTLLSNAGSMMKEDRYGLIIIDSCISHLRADYRGRGELQERQNKLTKILRKCMSLSDQFGVAVVITNQVVARVDCSPAQQGKEHYVAVGGTIMAHMTTTKLKLRRGKEQERFARVVQSTVRPEEEVRFCITARGIEDVE